MRYSSSMFFKDGRIEELLEVIGDLEYRVKKIEADIQVIYLVIDAYTEKVEATGQICELKPMIAEVIGILNMKKGVPDES